MLSIYCCYLHTYILGGQELGLSKKSLVVTKCEGCKVYTTLASTYIYDAQDVQMCYFFVWYKKENRYIHHRDCKQSPFCSKICGEEHKTSEQLCACEHDMQSREPQVALAAHMSRPHVHLFCIIGHRFLSKRDCLPTACSLFTTEL